jgi:hypothetical protein
MSSAAPDSVTPLRALGIKKCTNGSEEVYIKAYKIGRLRGTDAV